MTLWIETIHLLTVKERPNNQKKQMKILQRRKSEPNSHIRWNKTGVRPRLFYYPNDCRIFVSVCLKRCHFQVNTRVSPYIPILGWWRQCKMLKGICVCSHFNTANVLLMFLSHKLSVCVRVCIYAKLWAKHQSESVKATSWVGVDASTNTNRFRWISK